jgi:hypothetical protein
MISRLKGQRKGNRSPVYIDNMLRHAKEDLS